MKALDYLKNYYLLVLALLLFFVAININHALNKPLVVLSKQDETWNLNDDVIQKFNLGFKRMISSLLWISTILESDIEHYKENDTNSWMFLRFNTISKLEPKFYENYAFGGLYLSIVKDDIEGASIIYQRGLSWFPEDFLLLRDAGFHFHFEVGDYVKSYEIFSKLKAHKKVNPVMISNLARLESEKGNLQIAFDLLREQLTAVQDQNSFLAVKIKAQLYAIQAEIDLNCLGQNLKNCSEVDFFNKPYIKKGKIYSASQKWEKFRIKPKKLIKLP